MRSGGFLSHLFVLPHEPIDPHDGRIARMLLVEHVVEPNTLLLRLPPLFVAAPGEKEQHDNGKKAANDPCWLVQRHASHGHSDENE